MIKLGEYAYLVTLNKGKSTGVRPNRSRVNPIMPHGRFAHLKPADLDAIVAYLRSLKPVRHMIDK